MTWLTDLSTTRGILDAKRGGTGNDKGWTESMVVPVALRTGTAAIGSVVRLSHPGSVVVVADEDADDVFGVVVGIDAGGGVVNDFGSASAGDRIRVLIAGLCWVLLEDEAAPGMYASPADTPGAARALAVPADNSFGRFLGRGSAGDTALVKIGGGGGGGGLPAGTDGQGLILSGGLPAWATRYGQCESEFVLPSNGQLTRPTRVPYDCTITGWTLLSLDGTMAPMATVAEMDIWAASYAAGPPMDGSSSIVGTAPALVSASKATGTSLSGWTTALSRGDWLRARVDAVIGAHTLLFDIHVRRTT